jgi:uncharacterized protein
MPERPIYCSVFILDVIQFITYTMIELEWDETKRASNLKKHGIDFADALEFEWENAIRHPDLRRDYGEKRFLALGIFRGRIHSVSFTIRDGIHRIISFRKANHREMGRYEKEKSRSQ